MQDKIVKKSAVIIDGGYLRKVYEEQLHTMLTASRVVEIGTKILTDYEELFRIYYYDCQPFEKELNTPISGNRFSNPNLIHQMKTLFSQISTSDLIAFRSGKLKFGGWGLKENVLQSLMVNPRPPNPLTDNDFRPMFKQKGTDMKIGLDIAWLSIRKIVDRIILVAGDADFVPAMKLARVEGVQIILVPFQNVNQEIKEHSDELRILNLQTLLNCDQ